MTVPLNKYSFCRMHMLPPFCIKTNLRENRFFAPRWTIGRQKQSCVYVRAWATTWTNPLEQGTLAMGYNKNSRFHREIGSLYMMHHHLECKWLSWCRKLYFKALFSSENGIRDGLENYCPCKGFQPWAVISNSVPSRATSCLPNSGFVICPMSLTPSICSILEWSPMGTVNSNS